MSALHPILADPGMRQAVERLRAANGEVPLVALQVALRRPKGRAARPKRGTAAWRVARATRRANAFCRAERARAAKKIARAAAAILKARAQKLRREAAWAEKRARKLSA